MSNSDEKSALKVNKGIEQPPIINPNAIQRFKRRKRELPSAETLINGILEGNRTILSQAITMVESTIPAHQRLAQQIIEKCLPYSGKSVRIGITGVPGVGKSSFIEVFGKLITSMGRKLAVLAIDPSSDRTKGSILGDKTRMEKLTGDANAFIRPSPSTGSLGGVANKTRESIILCEAAGFNTIFVETVGVGQSETTVHSMVDFFLLLMLAGAGDELQGIKRGIMEMADAIVITKADGNNIEKAHAATTEYKNALHLFPPTESGWEPKVLACSAHKNSGINEIWEMIEKYIEAIKSNDFFNHNRKRQARHWMYETINESLKNNFYQDDIRQQKIQTFEQKVLNGEISSYIAAKELLKEYFLKNNISLLE